MNDYSNIYPSPTLVAHYDRLRQLIWAEHDEVVVSEPRDEESYFDQMISVTHQLAKALHWGLEPFAAHWGTDAGNVTITVLFE